MINSYNTTEGNINSEISTTENSIKNGKYFEKSPLNHLETKNNKQKNLKVFYGSLDYKILILNIIGIIFYQISFIGCHGGEENYCITEFVTQFIILGLLLTLSSLFVGITIFLIIWKKISLFHLMYIIPTYYIYFYYYDMGETLEKHGHINFIFFNVFLFCFILILNYFYTLLKLFKKQKYFLFILMILLLLIFPLYKEYVQYKSKCNKWEYGLNNEKMIYLKNESCVFYRPQYCELDFYFGKFNMSKIRIKNYNKKKLSVKYLSNENKKSNHLGYPIITNINLKNKFDNYEYNNFVSENMINMEKYSKENKTISQPEFTVNFDKKGEGHLKINLIKNETLSKERKKLENPKSLFKNLLIIYIDSASRIQFKRGLKNLFNFLESFMKKTENKKQNYNVYQFFKYHSLGSFTHINVQPMFYGNSMISNKGIEFIKYYKENGFITGFSLGMCSPEVFNDKYSTYTKKVEKINWDHESNVLFCDPNFFDKEFGGTSYKGSNNFSKRILYGKQVNEIQIEYAKQFWEKYSDNNKVFKLAFMDGHEDTSETISFLDYPLTNFLNELYNKNLLEDTSIFFVSDHGLHMPRIHLLLSKEQFIHDRSLPLLIMFYDDKNFILNNNQIMYNQQKFVTAYDIYETLLHICFGEEQFKNSNGKSLFSYIDESQRNCEKYYELKSSDCRCLIK